METFSCSISFTSYGQLQARRAIEQTIEMWTDMQTELGEKPSPFQRVSYKTRWCNKHGYDGSMNNRRPDHECFLCEFAKNHWRLDRGPGAKCESCPIKWPEHLYEEDDDRMFTPGCNAHRVDYLTAPLSDILEYLKDESNWRYE